VAAARAADPPRDAAAGVPTVTFVSGGRPVKAWRFDPPAAGVTPALLLLHGSDGPESVSKDVYCTVARRLASQGYVVFLVHYFDRTDDNRQVVQEMQASVREQPTGAGARRQGARQRQHFEAWVTAVTDATAHIRKQPGVDGERVGIVGLSLGAYLAVAVAAREDLRIGAVVELFGGLPRELRAGLRHLPPVLIVHGDQDEVVPVREAYDLRNLLAARDLPAEVKIYPDVGHLFKGTNGAIRWDALLDAERRSLAFLRQHLGTGVPPRAGPPALNPILLNDQ
jgi:carboxymethylenebutenolidase